VGDPALKTKVIEDMKAALKGGDKVRLGALRMLLAAIKNKEVEGAQARELSDDEVRELAAKEVKKRAESIEAFDAAGRAELAEKEREEREVLAAYAPEQLTDAEVGALIDEAIAATGASSPGDGNAIQRTVRERLGA
jgi:uncharacterized protein YqeY